MKSVHHVLVATDFSELANQALQYGADLARVYRSTLHVMHVVASFDHVLPPGTAYGISAPPDGFLTYDYLSVLDEVRTQVRILETLGYLPPDLVTLVRFGHPWKEIANYAADMRIDLIVMGAHARGMMQRIFLGSTSRAVLQHVSCPVLMIPEVAEDRGLQPDEEFSRYSVRRSSALPA